MRVLLNPRSSFDATGRPAPADLTFIRQPRPALGLGFSILVGLALPFVPFIVLGVRSWLLAPAETGANETVPGWIIFPALIFCVLAHELLHLLGHPGSGRSDRSLVLIWPHKLQFGVAFDGFMPRSRWLVMRLLPLVGLTVAPTLLLLAVSPAGMSFFWRQFIVIVILINSLGAGGDLLASLIVARQVPRGAVIGIAHGRACWRPAREGESG